MRRLRHHLAPALVAAVLLATLALAATAAAATETKIGEGTSPEQMSVPGEADLLKGSLEYDLLTGRTTVAFTTRLAQETTTEAERPDVEYAAALINVSIPCTRESIEAASKEGKEVLNFPLFELVSANRPIIEPTPPGQPPAPAYAVFFGSKKEIEGGGPAPENFASATKVLSGTGATVTATVPKAANQAFNCVEVGTRIQGEEMESDAIFFPLTAKPEPPPVQPPAPPAATPAPAPAPGPAPAAFSITNRKRPLQIKAGAAKTVKVTVTNTGGVTTAPGSLRLGAAKGVIVKPGRQKLPALLPGGSWTVTYKIELTEKAKARTTLALTATGAGLTGKGSLVVRLKG